MNKSRFIECLNLYLDDELSEEESDKLLRAIRKNEEYQRMYVQYCQIHNACSQLGDEFAAKRPSSSVRQKVYAISGMAAAVALLGLAAQNLSPILGGGNTPSAVMAVDQNMASTAMLETLLVLDVDSQGNSQFSSQFADVQRFDVEGAFKRVDARFEVSSDIQYASFVVEQPEKKVGPTWKEDFSFGQPVLASTFEHEMLIAREDAVSSFSGAYPVAVQEGEVETRFSFGRSASFSSELETRVGVVGE